jgi:hypothetical protein
MRSTTPRQCLAQFPGKGLWKAGEATLTPPTPLSFRARGEKDRAQGKPGLMPLALRDRGWGEGVSRHSLDATSKTHYHQYTTNDNGSATVVIPTRGQNGRLYGEYP